MYERFYNLRERPFALSPDPEYLYPSRVHQEALDYLRYGLETQAGFIVITGEIGSGKTTLLQTLLRNLDSHTTVARIVNTMLEPRELIETIMIDFGLDPGDRSKALLLRDLSQFVVDQRLAGRMVLLVIDEAQNLSLAALEELRMLSNLETEKSKLLQIVMVGQPNLRDKLGAPELEQLRQRITVSYHLPPLEIDDTANYINHRLRRAALGAPLEFPREATDLIHARSRGVPRIINVICDAALVFGYAEERRVFDAPTIREVLAELETTGVLPPSSEAETSVPAAAPPIVDAARPGSPAKPPASSPALAPAIGSAHTVYSAASSPASAPPAVPSGPAPAPPPRPTAVAAPSSAASAPVRMAAVAALDEREARIRQREQELAEQRRILAEEYRLLRTQRQTPPDRTQTFAAEHGRGRPYAPSSGTARFQTPTESFWTRLKRFMLGVSTS